MLASMICSKMIALEIVKFLETFTQKSKKDKVEMMKKALSEHSIAIIGIAGIIVVASGCVLIPPKGRIITIGPEMHSGLAVLSSTPTGKTLIHKAQRSTRGSPIFLTLGNTEKNDLVDKQGNSVIGVTRTYFKNIASQFVSNGVFVTSNRDFLSKPEHIALNIAFELENVIYAMKYPGMEFSDDSPYSWNSLEKVAGELGLLK